MRRATCRCSPSWRPRGFQSTLSMRRATRPAREQRAGLRISIHALHEESDVFTVIGFPESSTFQSTLSMRRATLGAPPFDERFAIISIHALHEESDHVDTAADFDYESISIHALHEESDLLRALTARAEHLDFNPRSP